MGNYGSAEESYIVDLYLSRTAASKSLHEEAKMWLPGGDTRTINHHDPYPVFLERGQGAIVIDADENEYVDFNNNMSATVHGHGHPALAAAATAQIAAGTALGAPSRVQYEHARALAARVPSLRKVRYCNSGSEATMMAIRAARAFTGREVVVKIAGGYHGMHNDVLVSMFTGMSEPVCAQDGLPDWFPPTQVSRGVPGQTARTVLLLPYNDLVAAAELFRRHGARIAAVILEPMLGAAGCIPATSEYLRGMRELTTEHGALLVFDECVTFRVGVLQRTHGIEPDLTSLSKIIGGGLPIGAFGGREDVMAQFDPTKPDPLYHASAFSGNNMSLAVGLAALETFGQDEIARLNTMGDRLARDLTTAARSAGVSVEISGIGSLRNLHWGEGPLADADDAFRRRLDLAELPRLFHLSMTNKGVFVSRRGVISLSLPMTQGHIDFFVEAFRETLELLRPYIERELPHLLVGSRSEVRREESVL